MNRNIPDPSSFMEAYDDPIPERRMAWQKALEKEIKGMERFKV
jgi:hypothetical protein